MGLRNKTLVRGRRASGAAVTARRLYPSSEEDRGKIIKLGAQASAIALVAAPAFGECLAFERPSSTEWGTGAFNPNVFVHVTSTMDRKLMRSLATKPRCANTRTHGRLKRFGTAQITGERSLESIQQSRLSYFGH